MNAKQQLLFRLATRFYNEAESPSEEDMETVFHALITQDVEVLEDFIKSFGIQHERR